MVKMILSAKPDAEIADDVCFNSLNINSLSKKMKLLSNYFKKISNSLKNNLFKKK